MSVLNEILDNMFLCSNLEHQLPESPALGESPLNADLTEGCKKLTAAPYTQGQSQPISGSSS